MSVEEQLPEAFHEFWKMTKELPTSPTVSTNKENLSKEWNLFLETLKKRVEKDLE